ncbi:class D sortase [Sutcliffiella halmapala]|uniref:class D sortase n=1 Tax=Sutcliffiella halmapala TaxID=79882 RepID=UPI0009956141|nr:class D sortase [Sutcliffiella halmapala]
MSKWRITSIILFLVGAALFVGSGLSFWEGYSAVQKLEKNKQRSQEIAIVEKEFESGDLVASLFIPKLEVGIPIYHGVSEEELKKGIGHVSNSKLPGEKGNIVLSGHRDTVFKRLGELEIGDSLQIEMAQESYIYKIKKIRIVTADDDTVLVPKPRETLTITTCYPFWFIGSAPERYVVEAVRINS